MTMSSGAAPPVAVEVGDELERFYRFGGTEAELRCTKTSGRWAA